MFISEQEVLGRLGSDPSATISDSPELSFFAARKTDSEIDQDWHDIYFATCTH